MTVRISQEENIKQVKLFRRNREETKEEERFLSMQLISQEKDFAVGINSFKGTKPEWLMPQQKTFFSFLEKGKSLKGREGNRPTGACSLYYLSFFFFFFLSYIFYFSLLSYFLSILFFLSCSSLVFQPLFWAQWRSSYNACHDQILLFCSLTTFIWSGCTCRPPLIRLHHPLQLRTKKKVVLFIGLPWCPFLPRCRRFLSLSLMACT